MNELLKKIFFSVNRIDHIKSFSQILASVEVVAISFAIWSVVDLKTFSPKYDLDLSALAFFIS